MEIANLLNFRFSILGEFIGLQQTYNISPKIAPGKCFKFRYITTKETNVLVDSLNTSKPVSPSKIPAWTMKNAKAVLTEPLCSASAALATTPQAILFREWLVE